MNCKYIIIGFRVNNSRFMAKIFLLSRLDKAISIVCMIDDMTQ